MATPYEKLFDSFLSKIEDNFYTNLQVDVEADMTKLLNSAIVQFDFPKVDIFDKDDDLLTFNVDLSLHEIEILSNLMKLEWIKRQINSVSLLRQALGDKDFRLTSQANHLKVLLDLKTATEKEINSLITRYSYSANRQSLYNGLSGDSNG
jgi:hypothetical protein